MRVAGGPAAGARQGDGGAAEAVSAGDAETRVICVPMLAQDPGERGV